MCSQQLGQGLNPAQLTKSILIYWLSLITRPHYGGQLYQVLVGDMIQVSTQESGCITLYRSK